MTFLTLEPQIAVLILSFFASVGVALIVMAPLVVFYRRVDETNPNPVGRIFGVLTPMMASVLPASAAGRERIRKQLLLAGHYRPTAQVDYLALRAVLTFTPMIAGLVLAVFSPGYISIAAFTVGIMLGVLGFAWPGLYIQSQGSRRAEEIRRGLPMFMDTLGLVLSSGATLPEGMKRAADAVERGYPELSREVRLVVAQAELRSMSHALEAWRDRIPLPELGSLVFLLSQSDRLGTDITRGLWELSASLQVTSRQRAEAAANRSNFYMLFPTVFCLMLAAGIMLVGPGLVLLEESKGELDRALQEANKNNREAAKPAPTKRGPAPASQGIPILTP